MDVRFDRLRVDAVSIASGRTSSVHGFWTDANGAANKVTYTNCVAVGWTGTGAEHHGFTKYPGTTGSVRLYNCTAHGCAAGFSGGSGAVAKNCGAASCADGFSGTFDAGSTNNASNVGSDAPGTNPQNGVSPMFVSATADLHLASGDTAWKDRGVNLSADAIFPFPTDGDGRRTGTWDIGVDESSFETPTQVTQVTRYVNTASTPGGDGTTNDTVGANRAFASLVTALTVLAATNWAAANQQLRILCSGTTPDTGDAIVTSAWNGRLSPECYLEIIGDQPSALAILDVALSMCRHRARWLRCLRRRIRTALPGRIPHHGWAGDRRVFGGGRRRQWRANGCALRPASRRCRQHCLWPHVDRPWVLDGRERPREQGHVYQLRGCGLDRHGRGASRIHEGFRDDRQRPDLQRHGSWLRDWLRERWQRNARQELRGGELRERLQRDVRRGIDQQRQ